MTKRNPYFSQTSYSDDRIYSLMAAIAASVLVIYGLTGCSPVEWLNDRLGLKDDNVFETILEDVVESKTNYDIDLSPRSPDDDSYDVFEVWKKDF